MSMRWYQYRPLCVYCGEEFEASRVDAQYCSSKCRTAYHRREKRREEAKNGITDKWSNGSRRALANIAEELPEIKPRIYDVYINHGSEAAEAATLIAHTVFYRMVDVMNKRLADKNETIDRYKEYAGMIEHIRKFVKA